MCRKICCRTVQGHSDTGAVVAVVPFLMSLFLSHWIHTVSDLHFLMFIWCISMIDLWLAVFFLLHMHECTHVLT